MFNIKNITNDNINNMMTIEFWEGFECEELNLLEQFNKISHENIKKFLNWLVNQTKNVYMLMTNLRGYICRDKEIFLQATKNLLFVESVVSYKIFLSLSPENKQRIISRIITGLARKENFLDKESMIEIVNEFKKTGTILCFYEDLLEYEVLDEYIRYEEPELFAERDDRGNKYPYCSSRFI